MRPRAFKGTPNDFALWAPWVTGALPGRTGIPIGTELRTNRVVLWDPPTLRKDGVIKAQTFEVIADLGHGKTTLMTCIALRDSGLQAGIIDGVPETVRVRIDSRKLEAGQPEYTPLTEFLYSRVHYLARQKSLNIVHPDMGLSELDVVNIFVTGFEIIKTKPLERHENLVVQRVPKGN